MLNKKKKCMFPMKLKPRICDLSSEIHESSKRTTVAIPVLFQNN